MSISQAREQFSVVIKKAKQNQGDVIIENRGQAEAVIIPYSDYTLLQEAREKQRRQKAIEALKKLAQEVGARNTEMTTEEADQVADEVTREAINNLAK
jgi:prevent-host-death family protein